MVLNRSVQRMVLSRSVQGMVLKFEGSRCSANANKNKCNIRKYMLKSSYGSKQPEAAAESSNREQQPSTAARSSSQD